ncbi:MAG: hypothetical protein D6815_06305, partial [Candidatus Dadabacteria bacterium]
MKRFSLLIATLFLVALSGPAYANRCGQPVSNGLAPVATDAFYILQSAVGAKGCRLEHCDVNSDCKITAADSLGALRAAVGDGDDLGCSAVCPATIPCEEAGAPVCDGTCPAGYACMPGPGQDDADSDDDSDADSDAHRRVTVCHQSARGAQSITVSLSAVPAHLRHGDYEGPCEVAAAHKAGKGKGDKKGKKHEKGEDHGDSDRPRPPEPECVCEPVTVTTTTLATTTTTLMATTTTLMATTTTLP